MNNPLLDSCLEIANAGTEKRDVLTLPFQHRRFLHLSNYLLNNSNLEHIFHPTIKDSKKDESVTLLFSGGISSCILVKNTLKHHKATIIFVDYGQRNATQERMVYISLAIDTKRTGRFGNVDLDYPLKFPYPARNLVLAAIGSQYSHRVEFGCTELSERPDETSRFFRETNTIFTDFYHTKCEISAPYLAISQIKLVEDYLNDNGTFDALDLTWSCEQPESMETIIQCGKCYACYERFKLYQHFNKECKFQTHPHDGPNFAVYEKKYSERIG